MLTVPRVTATSSFTPLKRHMTKHQLFSLLTHQGCSYVVLPDTRAGYLDAIQREDGSGKSFNLTVRLAGGHVETFYVTTID